MPSVPSRRLSPCVHACVRCTWTRHGCRARSGRSAWGCTRDLSSSGGCEVITAWTTQPWVIPTAFAVQSSQVVPPGRIAISTATHTRVAGLFQVRTLNVPPADACEAPTGL